MIMEVINRMFIRRERRILLCILPFVSYVYVLYICISNYIYNSDDLEIYIALEVLQHKEELVYMLGIM